MAIKNTAADSQTNAQSPDFVERRRPGRIENVSPELIPILRGEYVADAVEDDIAAKAEHDELVASADDTDDVVPARGIFVAAVLGAILWLIIIGVLVLFVF